MKNFYAVRCGFIPGIYNYVEHAKDQVLGFRGSEWKGFMRYEDAQAYLNEGAHEYYTAKGCRFPAIYDDWNEALRWVPNVGHLRTHYSLDGAKQYMGNSRYEMCLREDWSYIDDDGVKIYKVYTDGACRNNQYSGLARGGVGVFFGHNNPNNISEPLRGPIQTNQRAELAAIYLAYQKIVELDDGECYDIFSDSSYAINCVTKWYKKWRRNGWYNHMGYPVLNADLIQNILSIQASLPFPFKVELVKVAAHSGDEGNDEADRLAVDGCDW